MYRRMNPKQLEEVIRQVKERRMLNTDGSVGVIADWAAAKGKKCTLVDYRWDIEKQVMEVLLECL